MTLPQPNINYSQGVGASSTNVFITVLSDRDPSFGDYNYPVTKRWVNVITGNEWILVGFNSFAGTTNPVWRNLSSGNVSNLNNLEGNSGGVVAPTNNTIQIVGDGTTVNVVGNPSDSTLTVSAIEGGSGIVTIDGNTGSVTGETITLNAQSAGISVSFSTGTSTRLDLHVTDSNFNTCIGAGAGHPGGTTNTALGNNALAECTGNSNVAVGDAALGQIDTGSNNIGIGLSAGANCGSSESSNIYLNNEGQSSESNCLRVGSGTGTGGGSLNKACISGINGSSPAGTLKAVAINGSDQLTAGGIITNGGQPAWKAYVSANINDVTGDSSVYSILYNSTLFDNGSHFNTSTGAYTAPVSGVFQINCTTSITSLTSSFSELEIQVVINSLPFLIFGSTGSTFIGSVGDGFIVSASQLVYANEGDTIAIQIFVEGGTKTVGIQGNGSGSFTNFSGFLVC